MSWEGAGVPPEVGGGPEEENGGRVAEIVAGWGGLADPMRGASAQGHDTGRRGGSDESGHAELATI